MFKLFYVELEEENNDGYIQQENSPGGGLFIFFLVALLSLIIGVNEFIAPSGLYRNTGSYEQSK